MRPEHANPASLELLSKPGRERPFLLRMDADDSKEPLPAEYADKLKPLRNDVEAEVRRLIRGAIA